MVGTHLKLRKIAGRLWVAFLLFYSGSMFIFLIPGIQVPSIFLILPFYIVVPGYVFASFFFPHLRILEKAVVSIGFNLALFVGIKALMHMLNITGLFPEFVILTIFSVICLIIKLATKG